MRLAEPLLRDRRAVHVRIAGEQRLIAAEDAGRYRDGLGVMPPAGLPDVFLEGGPESLRQLVLRFAKGRGPFTTAELDERFGRELGDLLSDLEREELLVRGELRPGGTEREWCDPDVLRRLRRASLAALRKEVEPVEQEALARFLPSWNGIDRRASLREALVPLQALPLPVALWEAEVLPRRVPGYRPEQLDALCATGEVVWVGAGSDRVALYFREDAAALGQVAAAPRPEGEAHERIRAAFERGALFWFDLLAETGLADERGATGVVGPRVGRRGDERCLDAASRGASLRRSEAGTAPAALLANPVDRGDRDARPLVSHRAAFRRAARAARARRVVARTARRDHARRRSRRGDPRRVRRRLRRAARARDARALPPRLLRRRPRRRPVRARRCSRAPSRASRARGRPPASVLAAADPAQAYGAALPWPKRAGARAARVAGARVVLLGGEPVLYVERGGRSLLPLRDPDDSWLRPALAALVAHVKAGGAKRLAVERFDGEPVTETDVMPLLVEAGFLAGPRRAVLRP